MIERAPVCPTNVGQDITDQGGAIMAAEVLVDFITSLDGYASGKGWPGS